MFPYFLGLLPLSKRPQMASNANNSRTALSYCRHIAVFYFLIFPTSPLEANPIDLGQVIISFSIVPLILLFEVFFVWLMIRSYIKDYREFFIKWFFVNVISWLSLFLFLITVPNLNSNEFELEDKLIPPGWKTIVFGETMAALFEGFFLYSFLLNDYFENVPEKKLSMTQCQLISFLANLASFLFPFAYIILLRFSGDLFFNLF